MASREAVNPERREGPSHGTVGRYHRGCRCADCRGAKAAYDRAWRKANPEYFREWRKANAPLPGDDDPRHGTRNGYYYGCRCTDCRDAAAEYERALRGRRRDAAR